MIATPVSGSKSRAPLPRRGPGRTARPPRAGARGVRADRRHDQPDRTHHLVRPSAGGRLEQNRGDWGEGRGTRPGAGIEAGVGEGAARQRSAISARPWRRATRALPSRDPGRTRAGEDGADGAEALGLRVGLCSRISAQDATAIANWNDASSSASLAPTASGRGTRPPRGRERSPSRPRPGSGSSPSPRSSGATSTGPVQAAPSTGAGAPVATGTSWPASTSS
jgi:hypothetical protein